MKQEKNLDDASFQENYYPGFKKQVFILPGFLTSAFA